MSRPAGARLASVAPLALATALVVAALAVAGAGCGESASSRSPKQSSDQASHGPNGPNQQGGSPGAQAAPGKLLGTVEASGGVTLTTAAGRPVTRLHSGWYTIFVTVNTAGADFHLTGPSVDSVTKTKIPGVALWGVHLLEGIYRYKNDRDARARAHVLSVY